MEIQEKIEVGQYKIDIEKNQLTLTDSRWYFNEKTQKFVPSVSTILKYAFPMDPFLLQWLRTTSAEESGAKLDIGGYEGSLTHQAIERLNNGEEVTLLDANGKPYYSAKVWRYITRYYEFYQRYKPRIIMAEQNFIGDEYAGTLDMVVEMEVGGKVGKYLVDVKTSNQLGDSYFLQLSAYRDMYEKEHGPLDGMFILWLSAKTKTEGKKDQMQGPGWQCVFSEKTHEHYQKIWVHTLAMFNEQFSDLKPQVQTLVLSLKLPIKNEEVIVEEKISEEDLKAFAREQITKTTKKTNKDLETNKN